MFGLKFVGSGCWRARKARLPAEQAEAVMRAIADAQQDLVTKHHLHLESAPIRSRLDVLTWAVGVDTAARVGLSVKLW